MTVDGGATGVGLGVGLGWGRGGEGVCPGWTWGSQVVFRIGLQMGRG